MVATRDLDETLKPFAVHVVRVPEENWTGEGVYLGRGLVLTAGHVAGAFIHTVHVQTAGLDLPTQVLKRGWYSPTDDSATDLALLSIDDTKLPLSIRLRRMHLCEGPPVPGEEVVVVTPERFGTSNVISPTQIPRGLAPKFRSSMVFVPHTGDSGSGVFDAERQCLLGIISAKITVHRRISKKGPIFLQNIDIAKHFVSAPMIAQFVPPEHRF
jgi:S1-C subfamily serine protease